MLFTTDNRWTVKNPVLCKALGIESRGYKQIDLVKLLWKYIRIHQLSDSFQVNLDQSLGREFGVAKTDYGQLKTLFIDKYVVVYKPIIKLKKKV